MSWLDTLEEIRRRDFSDVSDKERNAASREVINMASYACAVFAVTPLPFSEGILTLPVQTGMVMTIGHIHGRKLSQAQSKDLIVELTALAGVSFLARQGIKALLPMVGALITIPAAFAANWAIGRVAMEYFKDPGTPSERLRTVYADAVREGKRLFSKAQFDRFRKNNPAPGEEPTKKAPKGRAAKKKGAAAKRVKT